MFSEVEEVLEDVDDEYTTIKVEPTRASSTNSPVDINTKHDMKCTSKRKTLIRTNHRKVPSPRTSCGGGPTAQNIHALYKNVEQENGLPEFYYGTPSYISPIKKDSFDLFFESISASVKNLPPKLAAEVKSKVSQVIAEFELRAICEKEAEEKAQQSVGGNGSSQVANLLAIDSTINSNSQHQNVDGEVTHYVYTYQPKI